MTRGAIVGLLAATLVGLALRCIDLDRRPMHNDEAVNAIKFRSLWEQAGYRYDPNEHHGPALPYFTLAWSKLTGAPDFARFDEARLRMLTALFGVGLIVLLAAIADGLGRGATVCAGLLTAISPALVYYSRDYIHETLLVFFTLLALATGWRYFRTRKLAWALLAGAAVGLMQTTKETFVLALAAAALALAANSLWARWLDGGGGRSPVPWKVNHFVAAVVVWLIVALLFFSSFFTNAGGPLDAVRTYLPWLHRAAGNSPHLHPWHFYLDRLAFYHVGGGPIWSEGLILGLGLAGLFVALARKGPPDAHPGFLRFLALYTLALTAVYSCIAYKTPWCLLGFWHGWILLAGIGAVTVLQRLPGRGLRIVAGVVLLAGAGQLAGQAWQAGVTYGADRTNPYVYAQTSPDVLLLADQVQALAQTDPRGHHLLVKVMAPGNDYWPLPWYLRAFDQTGWWSQIPADPWAPAMIVSTKFKAELDAKGTHVMVGMYELRPAVFFELYVQADLWRAYLDSRTRKANDQS